LARGQGLSQKLELRANCKEAEVSAVSLEPQKGRREVGLPSLEVLRLGILAQ
jgi:hypothetical protein